ncbi:MAG: hypothetical protein ABW128_06655 [Rhizorhabdus sp.]
MFALGNPDPVERELIPARGELPAVRVTFNAQPSPLSLRMARKAAAAVYREGRDNPDERAGDAFGAEIVRYNILAWSGIGTGPDQPVEPTHDREILDEKGDVTSIERGTISAFIAEARLMEAADREYVLPWALADAEKNGFAPSLNGISAGATAVPDTASLPAKPDVSADAAPAPTKSTRRGRTKARPSGS